jgi:uncharacterized damage-inducible protein DinB
MDAGQMMEAWGVHGRLWALLLDNLPQEALPGVPVGMKGRSVGEIFAHVHNTRLMWLEVSPKLMAGVAKIPVKSKEDKAALSVAALRAGLAASHTAMAALFQEAVEKGKAKYYKRSPTTFYSYVVAHEWYHIGEICMTLTQAGHKLDDKVLYGIWEWDKV